MTTKIIINLVFCMSIYSTFTFGMVDDKAMQLINAIKNNDVDKVKALCEQEETKVDITIYNEDGSVINPLLLAISCSGEEDKSDIEKKCEIIYYLSTKKAKFPPYVSNIKIINNKILETLYNFGLI